MIRTLDTPLDDPHPPQPGDLLATARRLYLVKAAEPVETRIRCSRWRLDCELLDKRTNQSAPFRPEAAARAALGGQYLRSVAYRKGEPPSAVWGTD